MVIGMWKVENSHIPRALCLFSYPSHVFAYQTSPSPINFSLYSDSIIMTELILDWSHELSLHPKSHDPPAPHGGKVAYQRVPAYDAWCSSSCGGKSQFASCNQATAAKAPEDYKAHCSIRGIFDSGGWGDYRSSESPRRGTSFAANRTRPPPMQRLQSSWA